MEGSSMKSADEQRRADIEAAIRDLKNRVSRLEQELTRRSSEAK